MMRKRLRVLHGELQTPPIGEAARVEIGRLIRYLQRGLTLSMPHSRPLPVIGSRVHELRVPDADQTWRVIYRVDAEEIVVAAVWSKKTQQTPQAVIEVCRARYRTFDGAGK